MKTMILILFSLLQATGLVKFATDEKVKPLMAVEEGRKRLFNVVKNDLRHANYKRTVDLAELYAKLITGEGMDTLLKQVALREDKDLFAQRVALTEHIIKGVCKNLMDVSFKLPRSTSIIRVLTHSDDGNVKDKTKKLEEIISHFWGDQSLEDFNSTRLIELNYTDPNSFIAYTWKDFDENKEHAQPYPVEISSKQAIDFDLENNLLKYLIAKYDIKVQYKQGDKTEEKDGEKYTMYLENTFISLTQTFDDEDLKVAETLSEDEAEKWSNAIPIVKIGNKVFKYTEPANPYNLGRVPAFRVGYVRDLHTKGMTYVNPFDAAVPLMKKTIKVNSELDLTMSLLAFARLIQYAPACDDVDCKDGKHRTTGAICKTCAGLGVKVSKSSQEAILMKMPKEKEDMVDPSKLAAYLRPPVDIVEFQDKYIDKLSNKCYKVIYGSEAVLKEAITTTATEQTFNMDHTYDALYPLGIKISKSWKFSVKMIAKISELDGGLVCSYSFGKDFKLKTKVDYYEERKMASEAQAPASVLSYIDNEIMRLNLIDMPEDYKRYQVRQSFNPFNGKSQSEILILLSSQLTTLHNKVLYAHLDMIFDEIELETKGNIYIFARDKQMAEIKQKVDAIVAQINGESQKTLNFPIDG